MEEAEPAILREVGKHIFDIVTQKVQKFPGVFSGSSLSPIITRLIARLFVAAIVSG